MGLTQGMPRESRQDLSKMSWLALRQYYSNPYQSLADLDNLPDDDAGETTSVTSNDIEDMDIVDNLIATELAWNDWNLGEATDWHQHLRDARQSNHDQHAHQLYAILSSNPEDAEIDPAIYGAGRTITTYQDDQTGTTDDSPAMDDTIPTVSDTNRTEGTSSDNQASARDSNDTTLKSSDTSDTPQLVNNDSSSEVDTTPYIFSMHGADSTESDSDKSETADDDWLSRVKVDKVGRKIHTAKQNTEVPEGNSSLQYCKCTIEAKNDRSPTGEVILFMDSGSALTLIDEDTAALFQLKPNRHARKMSGRSVWGENQTLDTRMDFWIQLQTTSGTKVRVKLRARVRKNLGLPILVGSSDMAANGISTDPETQTLSIQLVGDPAVTVRTTSVFRGDKPTIENSMGLDQIPGEDIKEIRSMVLSIQMPGSKTSKQQRSELVHEAERLHLQCRGLKVTPEITATLLKWREEELASLRNYQQKCTNTMSELRPELFPAELWPTVKDELKPRVKPIWDTYTSERLKEIIPQVMAIDISKEDDIRTAEEPYVRALLMARIDAFYDRDEHDSPLMKNHTYNIELLDNDDGSNLTCKTMHYSATERAFLEAKMRLMVRQGRVRKEPSEHSNAIVLVPYPERINKSIQKWGDSATKEMFREENEFEVSQWYRLTIDLRKLNRRTKFMRYPLPRIDDVLANKQSGRWTSGDVMDAFYTLRAEPEAQKYMGFTTHEGHYVMTVMPQGSVNAAMRWAEVIAITFEPLQDIREDLIVYQDDVFNSANDFETHMEANIRIFDRLTETGLKLKPSKYHANYRQMKVVGHIMTRMGRYNDPELVRAINDLGTPKTQGEVRSLLGLALVAREYIHGLSEILAPLQDLIKKGVDVVRTWTEDIHGTALKRLKKILTSKPVLLNIDLSKPFRVHVDACRKGRGVGAVLLQQNEHNGSRWQPVAYWSLKLTETERNYSATDLECKAIHDALEHWSVYLKSCRSFDVVTDHYALVYLSTKPIRDSNGRLMRYLMDIQNYRFNLIHRKGGQHLDADAVSRLLRYNDEMLRVLAREDLVERGPVTKKDEEDLEEHFGISLPYRGVDRPTIEELLDETCSRQQQWDVEDRLIVDKITLRHALEELVKMRDDLPGFEMDRDDFDEADNDSDTAEIKASSVVRHVHWAEVIAEQKEFYLDDDPKKISITAASGTHWSHPE